MKRTSSTVPTVTESLRAPDNDFQTPPEAQTTAPETLLQRKLKVKQRLTIPLLSMAHTPLLVAQIIGEPYVANITVGAGNEPNSNPLVVKVLDLATNLEGLLIVNAIIKTAFERAGGSLNGRIFQFRAGTIRENKRYRDIDVVEMETDVS